MCYSMLTGAQDGKTDNLIHYSLNYFILLYEKQSMDLFFFT